MAVANCELINMTWFTLFQTIRTSKLFFQENAEKIRKDILFWLGNSTINVYYDIHSHNSTYFINWFIITKPSEGYYFLVFISQ